MSKEPTRHQLSSRLAYSQTTPSFIKKLQNQVAGIQDDEEDEEDGNVYNENWDSSSGRPPVPRRPSPPQRPDDDPGSADEDQDDEKPQVIVLKEGKHLSSLEVENEKRRARGLPPLKDVEEDRADSKGTVSAAPSNAPKETKVNALSFSSTKPTGSSAPSGSRKRKIVGDALEDAASSGHFTKADKKNKKKLKKSGALLSFDDGGNDG